MAAMSVATSPQRDRATRARLLVALFALVAAARTGPAAEVDEERVAKVKAAYVLNFIRYTEWPEDAFDGAQAPIVVCVLGAARLEDTLEETVRGRKVEARAVTVQRVDAERTEAAQLWPKLQPCHVLYVGEAERRRFPRIVDAVAGEPMLIVGDTGALASDGAMLALNIEEDRVVFYANSDAIARSSIRVSSKVLQLARLVGDGGSAP
jgi:hypothetical protein